MNKQIISYILLLSPIILGMGSGFLFRGKPISKVKSKFNPPGWVFGVVWPILYLLLGYSSYLIWNSNSSKRNTYLIIYIIHLLLLTAWWPYFLYFPNRYFATASLIFLFLYAIIISILFSQINKTASYFLIPYILWLSFASFLSYNIV
jgi:benzodiazapine receptor